MSTAYDPDEYWQDRGGKSYREYVVSPDYEVYKEEQESFCRKLVAECKPERLLDFACGTGKLFPVWRDIPEVHGYDRAISQIEIARVEAGHIRPDDPYHLMHFLAEERLLGAVGYLACANAALDLTLDYIKERKAFGQTIADFQNSRFKMADMRMQIDVAQAFIDQCVEEHGRGELTADDAAKAKLFTSELEGRVMDECVQLHGGAGYMDEYPICRMYLNARVSRIYAGSSEIMREIIARSMGLDPRKK